MKTPNLMHKKLFSIQLTHFLWPASVSRWFSIRILLIGKMELDLPTPESNSPFPCIHVAHPPSKVHLEVKNGKVSFIF